MHVFLTPFPQTAAAHAHTSPTPFFFFLPFRVRTVWAIPGPVVSPTSVQACDFPSGQDLSLGMQPSSLHLFLLVHGARLPQTIIAPSRASFFSEQLSVTQQGSPGKLRGGAYSCFICSCLWVGGYITCAYQDPSFFWCSHAPHYPSSDRKASTRSEEQRGLFFLKVETAFGLLCSFLGRISRRKKSVPTCYMG